MSEDARHLVDTTSRIIVGIRWMSSGCLSPLPDDSLSLSNRVFQSASLADISAIDGHPIALRTILSVKGDRCGSATILLAKSNGFLQDCGFLGARSNVSSGIIGEFRLNCLVFLRLPFAWASRRQLVYEIRENVSLRVGATLVETFVEREGEKVPVYYRLPTVATTNIRCIICSAYAVHMRR